MAPDPSLLGDDDPYDHMDREAARLDTFYASLPADDLSRPTRCSDWNARDLLGHLAASEVYNHACLDDDVAGLLERVAARGATDVDSFNALGVADEADRPAGEVLDRWRASNGRTRREMRQRRGGELATMVGPYAMDWQAWHLADELAIHADDLGVPVDPDEADERLAWLVRFARFAVSESGKDVSIEPVDGGYRAASGGVEAVLSPADLVAAVHRRALVSGVALDEPLRSALPFM